MVQFDKLQLVCIAGYCINVSFKIWERVVGMRMRQSSKVSLGPCQVGTNTTDAIFILQPTVVKNTDRDRRTLE